MLSPSLPFFLFKSTLIPWHTLFGFSSIRIFSMLFMPISLLSLVGLSCFNVLQLLKTYANKLVPSKHLLPIKSCELEAWAESLYRIPRRNRFSDNCVELKLVKYFDLFFYWFCGAICFNVNSWHQRPYW